MNNILTAAQMRDFEKHCFDSGVSSLDIMYNAGCAIARRIALENPESVLFVCGSGNNGGDGFVAAAELEKAGFTVSVWAPDGSKTPDARFFASRCRCITEHPVHAGLICDCLFGTGFHGQPAEPFLSAIKLINDRHAAGTPVFAVDTPSGAGSDCCVTADRTLYIHAPKLHCIAGAAARFAGVPEILNVGLPVCESTVKLLQPDDLPGLLPLRSVYGHKGDYGSIAVFGGAPGMEGAALLCARAALACGVGKAVIISKSDYYLRRDAELMQADGLNFMPDAIAFGMGGGDCESARAEILSLNVPTILDADGLRNLTPKETATHTAPLVLTPHLGEASRLLGRSIKDIDAAPLDAAHDIAASFGCRVILKSWYTVIVDGDTYIINNPTDALAKAGSGDCLAGAAVAMLAQRCCLPCCAAALCHNLAGHKAVKKGGARVLARDIIENL